MSARKALEAEPGTKEYSKARLTTNTYALDARHVAELLGIGVNRFWQLLRDEPSFPAPTTLFSKGSCRKWIRPEVEEWVRSRPRVFVDPRRVRA